MNPGVSLVLKRRLMFVFSIVVAVLSLFLLLRFQVYPAFERIERDQAERQMLRAAKLVEARGATLALLNRQYSDWDQTYAYMRGDDPGFAESYLDEAYMRSIGLHFVALIDNKGTINWSRLYSSQGEKLALEDDLLEPLSMSHPLVSAAVANKTVQGVWQLKSGLLFVVSQPVRRSDGSGLPLGVFVTGYYMDNALLGLVADQADVSVQIFDFEWNEHTRRLAEHNRLVSVSLNDDIAPPPNWEAFLSSREGTDFLSTALGKELAEQGKHGAVYTEPVFSHDINALRHHVVVNDVFNEAVALVQMDTARDVTQTGLQTIRLNLVAMCAAALIIGGAFHLILLHWVFNPIIRVRRRMVTMLDSGELEPIGLTQKDEVGAMSRAFDSLILQLHATQEDLARKRNDALAASRSKSEFLATMSHEIRTPMNGVLGMTELLGATSLDEKQERFVATIRNSGELLLSVINDILDFSKIESGAVALELHPFNLRALAEDTLEFFAVEAHQKGLELVLDFPASLDEMYRGDSNRIRQILVNLLGNAVKFTETGEIVLRVSGGDSVKTETGHKETLLFEVTDTGIGIAFDKQSIIFDDFSQADGSATRQYGGTGLGLAITRHLVALMAGDINVESEPGKGSRFYFDIALETGVEVVKKASMASLEQLRVLVVDDNATNCEILVDQLAAWHMRADCVDSGARALKALRQAATTGRPYHLILLDWHMPLMTGPEVARLAYNDADIPKTPTIMLSSAFETDSIDDEPYVDGCLSKPVRQSMLLDTIVDVMASCDLTRPEHPIEPAVPRLGLRVLLAEDNMVNQQVAINMLQLLDCEVVVANNGYEALDALASHQFDVVLMDCDMPGMNGYDATEAIRADSRPAVAGTTIIALTAHVSVEARKKCRAVGMNDYLQKPYKLEELIGKLQPLAVPPVQAASAG